MLYLIIGFIAGSILNFFVLFHLPGSVVTPEWVLPLGGASNAAGSVIKSIGNPSYGVLTDTSVRIINGEGKRAAAKEVKDSLLAASAGGGFYITYKSTGRSLELFGIKGERYWQMNSREYPYLSRSAKLIFLMNGDQSAVRILDLNGRALEAGVVSGRLCNVIAFSETDDHGAIGFIDGTFSFISSRGRILYQGSLPEGKAVKSIAVSSNGRFGGVHGGDHTTDIIYIVDFEAKKSREADLESRHVTTTALHAGDDGNVTIIDRNRVAVFSKKGSLQLQIPIKEKREGFSTLSVKGERTLAGYTDLRGSARVLYFNRDGEILLNREFSNESFMAVSQSGNRLFLRGSERIYCYSLY